MIEKGGIIMRVNNRAVETLTFYQWLNQYELTTKFKKRI